MARIKYDRYLLDGSGLITITNSDADYFADISLASFVNPPIKLKFINFNTTSFEQLCLRAVDRDEIVLSDDETIRIARGELSGWRLVGAEFSPEHGLSVFYVKEPSVLSPEAISKTDSVSFHFLTGSGHLEVEIEVDYNDGLPVRRYIGELIDKNSEYSGIVTEYFGKRKVKKIEFSENETGDDRIPGYLCHITEY